MQRHDHYQRSAGWMWCASVSGSMRSPPSRPPRLTNFLGIRLTIANEIGLRHLTHSAPAYTLLLEFVQGQNIQPFASAGCMLLISRCNWPMTADTSVSA